MIEYALVYLIHIIAHHPDYSTDLKDLQYSALYIEFFLEAVATAENVSFLYSLAAQLKEYRDLYSTDSHVC